MKLPNWMKRPYKVTVSRQLGGLGDAILLGPTFRGLKEKYTGCEITVMTSWNYGAALLPDIFKTNPLIDKIVRVEPEEWATPLLKAHKRIAKNAPNERTPDCVTNCDLFIDLNVICAITEGKQQPNVVDHRSDIWARAAHVTPSSMRPILNLKPEELAWGRQWCDENLGEGVRVGVALAAVDPMREWPHSAAFCTDLQRAGYKVCSVGEHQRASDHIPAVIGRRIRETAAIVAHLDGFVTPDTGLLHVAGALGVPVLGIFGSTDPLLRMREYPGHFVQPKKLVSCACCWYTYPCKKNEDVRMHKVCMQRVTRELVMCELETMLGRFAPLKERAVAGLRA